MGLLLIGIAMLLAVAIGYPFHRLALRARTAERIAANRLTAIKNLERSRCRLDRGYLRATAGWQQARRELRETRNDLIVERAYAAVQNRELARLRDELAGKSLWPTLAPQDVTVEIPPHPVRRRAVGGLV